MKSRRQAYSELYQWCHLWDDRLKCGLRKRDVRKLKALGFDVDRTSFQLTAIRREEKPQHDWAATDGSVSKLLMSVFPKLKIDLKQRQRAGRWARIIHLYFRMGLSYAEVGTEIREKPKNVASLIRSITRSAAGKRTRDGVSRITKEAA